MEAMESSALITTIASDARATQINTVIIKDNLETINNNIILADANGELRSESLHRKVTALEDRLHDSVQALGDRMGPMVADSLSGVHTAIVVMLYTLAHQIDHGLAVQQAKALALEQRMAAGFGLLWSLADNSAQQTAAMFGLGLGVV
jgi:hypothetical protein